MIRFIDMTRDYWSDDEPEGTGPFAFANTRSSLFCEVGGAEMFFGRADFEEAASLEPASDHALIDRMRRLIPERRT